MEVPEGRPWEMGLGADVRRGLGAEGLLEAGLLFDGEGGLDHARTAEVAQFVEDAVGGGAGDEEEEGGVAGLDGLTDLFDELVIDTDVGELADEGAGGGADGEAEPGGEEEEADEHAPEAAAEGAGAAEVGGLFDLGLALDVARDDGGIGELDEVLALEVDEPVGMRSASSGRLKARTISSDMELLRKGEWALAMWR